MLQSTDPSRLRLLLAAGALLLALAGLGAHVAEALGDLAQLPTWVGPSGELAAGTAVPPAAP